MSRYLFYIKWNLSFSFSLSSSSPLSLPQLPLPSGQTLSVSPFSFNSMTRHQPSLQESSGMTQLLMLKDLTSLMERLSLHVELFTLSQHLVQYWPKTKLFTLFCRKKTFAVMEVHLRLLIEIGCKTTHTLAKLPLMERDFMSGQSWVKFL